MLTGDYAAALASTERGHAYRSAGMIETHAYASAACQPWHRLADPFAIRRIAHQPFRSDRPPTKSWNFTKTSLSGAWTLRIPNALQAISPGAIGLASEASAAKAADALRLACQVQDTHRINISIQHLATVAALRGDAPRAARLMGYADAGYRKIDAARERTEQRTYDILTEALHRQLGDDAIAQHASQGKALSEDQATSEALAVGDTQPTSQGSRAS